jgi:hypothetical protein
MSLAREKRISTCKVEAELSTEHCNREGYSQLFELTKKGLAAT